MFKSFNFFVILFLLIILNLEVFSDELDKDKFILQDFDYIGYFTSSADNEAQITLSSVDGHTDKALRIDYDLTKGNYVNVSGSPYIGFVNVDYFYWYMKGNANGNILEIKFIDQDGTIVGKKIPITSISEDKWTKYILPFKECHYFWGGSGKQKIDNLTGIDIAISRGIPKKGYIIIDDFCYIVKKTGEPTFEIELNQVGYHPNDNKYFIVRAYDLPKDKVVEGNFSIVSNNRPIYSNKLINSNFLDWSGSFFIGNFDEINSEGKYYISVELKLNDKIFNKKSFAFEISDSLFSTKTIPLELNYLHYQRCGIKCHKNNPVIGGYHDTLFDISNRMWSIPSLVYGLSKYVKDGAFHPNSNNTTISDDLDELIWGFDFITKVANEDGTTSWSGIEDDYEDTMSNEEFITYIGTLKPEDDKLPRAKHTDKNLYSTAYNLIAIINAIPLIEKLNNTSAQKGKEIALKAWNWINKQNLVQARDYGFYLWAATELYKFTKDGKFLTKVKEYLPRLLNLQALNFKNFENDACGQFYTSQNDKNFIYQYKYVSFNISINMALLNLLDILPQNDPLWFDVYYSNKVFAENFLKNMCTKTPYQQFANGIELKSNTKNNNYFELNYFSGPEGKAAAADNHGLNCDLLAEAYIAMRWGQYTDDSQYQKIANNQLNWVLGLNPLNYCMLIGAGSNNPVIMSEYYNKPKVPGIIPNGIVGSGKNDEPAWWGDSPSSGEDWLPHNASYLMLLSTIENQACIKGQVLKNSSPVADAKIEVVDNGKIVAEKNTDKNGYYETIELIPEKKYKLIFSKNDKKITKDIELLSGSNKELTIDIANDFDIKIIPPAKVTGKINFFTIEMPKNAIGLDYKISLKGAITRDEISGKITNNTMKISFLPDGDKPLLFRFEILTYPLIYKEIFYKAY